MKPEQDLTLLDLLDRLLAKGVVVHGDLTISVAGVDLLYIGLRALICSAEKVQELRQAGGQL